MKEPIDMITHRLSAIRSADQIILIQHPGSTVNGRHEELLERSELYNYIVKQQALT